MPICGHLVGFKEKSQVTLRFLQRKMDEYGQIKQKIASLKTEVEAT